MNITGTITNMEIMNTQQRIEQLEKELAELKRGIEFKEGEWVISTNRELLKFHHYGYSREPHNKAVFTPSEIYNSNHSANDGWFVSSFRKATPNEIKAALIKEAERRYNVPCRVKYLDGNGADDLKGFHLDYNPDTDTLYATSSRDGVNYSDALYRRGKWAEPIEEQPDIVVNGYKAEFYEGYVKFGCAEIDNHVFRDLLNVINAGDISTKGNRYIKAVKIGEGLFDVETIYQICERLR